MTPPGGEGESRSKGLSQFKGVAFFVLIGPVVMAVGIEELCEKCDRDDKVFPSFLSEEGHPKTAKI